jgi:hypothetical protein
MVGKVSGYGASGILGTDTSETAVNNLFQALQGESFWWIEV